MLLLILILLTMWFAYWCGSLATYENPEITGDVIWLQYCARNWLQEVPVTVCVDGQCEIVMVYMDYEVLVSRSSPEIPDGAGVGWNDYSCWQGNAVEVECNGNDH